jgi:uncharacterized membrane protein
MDPSEEWMTSPYTFDDQPPAAAPPAPAKGNTALLVVAAGAALGVLFAGVSTSDFISHLDRQVHSIHCSFIPGAGAEIGESGCRTVMMSPYSSVLRESVWGGLPISLLAVAVFAYLVMFSLRLFLSGRQIDRRDTTYLVAATLLPVAMSVIYGAIAINVIGAVCKLCAGVYLSSALCLIGAVLAHRGAPRVAQPADFGTYARWFGEGVLYVGVLSLFYVMFAPSSAKTENGCGTLVKKDDGSGIMIPLGRGKGTPAIAVVDPLCPACKGFDGRLRASDLYDRLAIQAVLFPLDSSCNWMVKEALHPGACTVSEAMLCDKDNAEDILDYAFEHQEELRGIAKKDDAKLRARLEQQFPKIKGCLGSAKAKNQVNKSLKWAVANAIPVLTPQLFIGDKRVCDEDTDLGLEFTVARMLEGRAAKKGRR